MASTQSPLDRFTELFYNGCVIKLGDCGKPFADVYLGGHVYLKMEAAGQTVNDNNNPDVSHTTYYIAPLGAMVFATGSIYWTYSLDNYRFDFDQMCVGQNLVVSCMQQLMWPMMDALLINHPRNS